MEGTMKAGKMKIEESRSCLGFKRIVSIAAVTAIALSLSACSSIDPRMAASLAEKGMSVSNNSAALYESRANSLERYLEGECVMAAIKKGRSLPTEKMVSSVDSVKQGMILRSEMFAKLAETYKAFERLALYDDNGAIASSFHGLTDSVNSYATALGRPVPIASNDADIAALAGRGLFEAYHKSHIAAASTAIRARLKSILKLLEDSKERKAVLAMEKVEDRAKLKLALALWKSGLALPDAIVNEHVEVYGLIPNKSVTIRQTDKKTTGKMETAIANVLKFRNKREIRTRKKAYDAVLAALKKLVEAHLAMERGEPLSATLLSRKLREIREYAEILSKI